MVSYVILNVPKSNTIIFFTRLHYYNIIVCYCLGHSNDTTVCQNNMIVFTVCMGTRLIPYILASLGTTTAHQSICDTLHSIGYYMIDPDVATPHRNKKLKLLLEKLKLALFPGARFCRGQVSDVKNHCLRWPGLIGHHILFLN